MSCLIRGYWVRKLKPTLKILIEFKCCNLVLIKISSNYLAHICDLSDILTDCAAAEIWPCSRKHRCEQWEPLYAKDSLEIKTAAGRHLFDLYPTDTFKKEPQNMKAFFIFFNFCSWIIMITQKNSCSKYLKIIARKGNVSRSLWNDLKKCYLQFFIQDLLVHFLGKVTWFYISYAFLKFTEIHYYELQHHCSPICSVHYVKKYLSAVKKKKKAWLLR